MTPEGPNDTEHMDNSHPLLPGPRPPTDFALPASFPPAPRRWSGQMPMSQSRGGGGYISPDPSPTEEAFLPPARRMGYVLPRSEYFLHGQDPNRRVSTDERMMARSHPGVAPQRPGSMEVDPYYYPAVPKQMGEAQPMVKSRRASKKMDGKQPTFLTKLYQILEQPEYHHIIRWDDAGEVIVIEKPDELADKVLPLVYRQSRFASFSRQLNIYGFMRKVSLRHVDREICDPDASTWSHPFLRRDSPAAEIQGFKRRVPPRVSQSARRRSSVATIAYRDDNHSLGLSPTSSEESYQSPPDAYQHHLLTDVVEDKPAVFNNYHRNAPRFSNSLGNGNLSGVDSHSGSSPESGADYETWRAPPFPFPPLDHGGLNHGSLGHYQHRPELAFDLTPMPRPLPVISKNQPTVPSQRQPPPPNNQQPRESSFLSSNAAALANPRESISGASLVPSSAPAHIAGFPSNGSRIAQGHIRTRSVQGEPPSATMFSPTTPMGHPNWMSTQPPLYVEPQLTDPAARGMSNIAPTYDPNDSSTWSRRGYTDLNTGAYVDPPANRVPIVPIHPNDMAGNGSNFMPNSLPGGFAGGYVSPTSQGPPSAALYQQTQANQHSQSQHPPHSFQQPQHQHPPQQAYYAQQPQAIAAPATVSPGVYQSGFALPTYKPAYAPSTPRAVPSRQERRESITSSPYSPRSKSNRLPSLGPLRGIGGMTNDRGREDEGAQAGHGHSVTDEDPALPSAGLGGFHRGPFDLDNVLPHHGGMAMAEGD